MAYCGPIGIPHSIFLGRVPRKGESAWTPEDRAKAVAWVGYSRSKCPECNTFPEDYLDEDGRDIYPPPYIVQTERCGGCLLIKAKTKEIGNDNLVGISMRMVPNPRYKGR